jgi:glycosyltransferase involved in cell wall biosynthesis
MSKISVIMPTYNCAAYIAEALTSVLKQTLSPYEILVIDDGSTDNTKAIVMALDDARIRYLKQENAGVSAARNCGLQHATGEYIAFLDADDRWLPDMLARQYATLSRNPELVFSFTNFIRFDDPQSEYPFLNQFTFYPELLNAVYETTGDAAVKIITADAFCYLVNFGEVPAYTQAIMFRSNAVKGLKFDCSLKVCEDAEFVLRCAALGRVAYDETVLLEVRRHDSNATRDISLIAVDKLASFVKLLEFKGLTPVQNSFLLRRLAKAHWDAANAQLLAGQRTQSWRNVKSALLQPGTLLSKAKRFARWLFTLLHF